MTPDETTEPDPTDEPTDREVVETASRAAEGVVLDRYKQSELHDFDVTVTFVDGVLDVDVYVNPPAEAAADADEVADEAARAARDAVDDLFDGA
ncbi:DUF3194 domain-containing protein [Candidatus Halobonum tyrrellensis]|uniref:DUF3194 domain-containing protein n=1 Tax=Candidatus Halobonum tyrrellensis G22 TaxID=1324957 RepID=V4HG48_9EURY|nr:DUF3194 domain-containing protein [Candidatus Halobonum tyrrellensis]ESP89690.1 hypothetical protein K933_02831 [Candidatus Halobonum tyrrellensis G22]